MGGFIARATSFPLSRWLGSTISSGGPCSSPNSSIFIFLLYYIFNFIKTTFLRGNRTRTPTQRKLTTRPVNDLKNSLKQLNIYSINFGTLIHNSLLDKLHMSRHFSETKAI